MNKRIIAANDLLLDSFQLAANIHRADFKPDFLVGLWRKEFSLRQGAIAAVTALLVSLPLFVNSWQVTHDLGFITGTNGWNDMPAAYSRELAQSGSLH